MKFFAAISLLLIAVAAAQDSCPQLRYFEEGTCNVSSVHPCFHPCGGDEQAMVDAENCPMEYCCLNSNNECVLKEPNGTIDSVTVDVNGAAFHFLSAFSASEKKNEMKANITAIGRFTSLNQQSFCPTFPFNCPINPHQTPDFSAPINIPYCQRIACSPSNPFLDSDYQACIGQPGCYFDQELFRYRQLAGQSILPGVPICHLVIRNRAFQKRAAEVTKQLGAWNPLLTTCIIINYRDEILGDAVGCHLLDYLVYFGHTPKRAGWTGITDRECALIGACWRRADRFCAYPSNSRGEPTVRSSNDASNRRQGPSSYYGLPVCYPLQLTPKSTDFLSSYHTCLASGCAANVDQQTLWNHLIQAGSSLPFPYNTQYISMVYSGACRPDNYQTVLANIIPRPPSRPTYYPTILPNSFNIGGRSGNVSAKGLIFGGGNQGQQGAGVGNLLGSLAGAGFGNLFGTGGGNPLGNLGGLGFPVPPILFPPGFVPPVNPCPYAALQTQSNVYPGLPRLTGSFVGCCDQPLCYTPKTDLYNPYSGVSSYLSQWSQWKDCSVSCGGGLQNRTRSCVGGSCSANSLLLQTRTCNTHKCPRYSSWGPWSACSATCGGGTRTRSRVCEGTGTCTGDASESEPCRTGQCPTYIDGPWSACSNTCGRGTRTRRRRCTSHGAYGCGRVVNDESPCEQFCGNYVCDSGNSGTCCYVCRQENGRPGHCPLSFHRGQRCYEGNCLFRHPVVCP